MTAQLIDTHAHLMMCKRPMAELVENARHSGVSHIVNVALTIDSAKQSLESAQQYTEIIPTAGLYPSEVGNVDDLKELETLLKTGYFHAIGEIGLDYYRCTVSPVVQKKFFESQLDMALRYHLPVIIHNREADEDLISILTQFPDVRCVLHCYSSGMALAERVMGICDAYFSFTGMVTYSKKGKTVEAIKALPLDRLMIETDCPYLLPQGIEKQENQPAFVGEVAKKMAALRDSSFEDIAISTATTAKRFFNI